MRIERLSNKRILLELDNKLYRLVPTYGHSGVYYHDKYINKACKSCAARLKFMICKAKSTCINSDRLCNMVGVVLNKDITKFKSITPISGISLYFKIFNYKRS